jgi:hypothetical protein
MDPAGSVWRNVADIKGHHIIHSAHADGPSLFIEVNRKMIPISYPSEPLIQLISLEESMTTKKHTCKIHNHFF